ncbi:membrane protein involved in colicin uptake [Paenarthrobacter sp. TE4293]
MWLDSATAKKLSDDRAAEAAAKAAAEKAAADKAAADKATADKAAADQAAAAQAAAAKAAADKAAADKAVADAATAKLVPKAVPAAPQAQSNCDPNYSGCVPVASDVDCAGGSGNGPAYVRGPVTVTGSDIYGLDNDKDGVGCEK